MLPLDGFRYMKRHPSLWRYGWFPLILNTLITVAVIATLFWISQSLYQVVAPLIPEGWLGNIVLTIGAIGAGILILALGIGTALVMSIVLCSFFYGKLAEQTERKLGVREGELVELSLWIEIRDTMASLTELIVANILFLAFNFIPLVGGFVAGGATWYFNAFVLGNEFLEYGWSLRGWDRPRRRRYAKAHRMHTLGLGTVAMGFQLVPILGALVLTTGVVGGVLYRRRAEYFRLNPTP